MHLAQTTGEGVTNWQAVAIVLINMVGSVLMAWFRETTNRERLPKLNRNGTEKLVKPK
jgi:hypothetical protein